MQGPQDYRNGYLGQSRKTRKPGSRSGCPFLSPGEREVFLLVTRSPEGFRPAVWRGGQDMPERTGYENIEIFLRFSICFPLRQNTSVRPIRDWYIPAGLPSSLMVNLPLLPSPPMAVRSEKLLNLYFQVGAVLLLLRSSAVSLFRGMSFTVRNSSRSLRLIHTHFF